MVTPYILCILVAAEWLQFAKAGDPVEETPPDAPLGAVEPAGEAGAGGAGPAAALADPAVGGGGGAPLKTDDVPPVPEKLVKEPLRRNPSKNKWQQSVYLPDGRVVVSQIVREKAQASAQLYDTEHLAEIAGFLYEVAEWGTDGPSGGFSISGNQPKRIAKSPRFGHVVAVKRRNTEGLPNYVKVKGRFHLIPKEGSEAMKEYRKRAAPILSKYRWFTEADEDEDLSSRIISQESMRGISHL